MKNKTSPHPPIATRPSATQAMKDLGQQGETQEPWWKNGVRFECQGSGKCCVSHGEFGFVYMTLGDRQRMARHLGLRTAAFTRQYCVKSDGFYHLKESGNPACQFLEGTKCGVYEGRPTQCRTWPFWPEVMSAKAWRREVASFCPGVGKGRVWTASEIAAILAEQAGAEVQV